MTFEIYHQLGHRDVWSLQSIDEDQTGDGVIISPRSRSMPRVEKLGDSIKRKAIFDPQILNPKVVLKNMESYDFYPGCILPAGFDTDEYIVDSTLIAERCIDFQVRNNFRFLVIPTRFYQGMPPVDEFIENQNQQSITPFLSTVKKLGLKKEMILQLFLTGHMIKNKEYTDNLLNWITGIEGISGIYLVTELHPRQKQIRDAEFLLSLLNFTNSLYKNKMKTILGYLNSESLLLSIANPSILTIGSYGNVRIFHHSMFEISEKDLIQIPNLQIYVPTLIDWLDYPYIEIMKRKTFKSPIFFGDNKYLTKMLNPGYRGTAHNIEPHKHYYIEMSKQLRQIRTVENQNRYQEVCKIIESAKQGFSQLDEAGIDVGDKGAFLPHWLTAAKQFAEVQGWGV
ncbi:MAG: hypothetical protein ABSG49_10790 [Methanoregula sp.]|jgi:hypothetical protein|uniref:hypothetical protein n=1 Tax=Methanoregula sp. TaxID=2052170 RepID=UPI003C24B491